MDNKIAKKELFEAIRENHKRISQEVTPPPYIEHREDGFDYVDEGYMRNQLNHHYPIWSWEIKKYEVLGDVEIIVQGRLTIVDEGLPRYFDSVASHRIAKNDKGYVNISNNLKAANTDAFKVAANRLCNIADDIYRKQLKDYNLSDEQKSEMTELADKLDDKTILSVKQGIEEMSIHSDNYEKVIKTLNRLIKENEDVRNKWLRSGFYN